MPAQKIILVESEERFRDVLFRAVWRAEGALSVQRDRPGRARLMREGLEEIRFVDGRVLDPVREAEDAGEGVTLIVCSPPGQGEALEEVLVGRKLDGGAAAAGDGERVAAEPDGGGSGEARVVECGGPEGGDGRSPRTLADREREWILRTLRETGNNKAETARRLGVSARTIRNKLREMEAPAARVAGASEA
jgi:hypothetical protein